MLCIDRRRAGYTMLELIFIIMIIGILSAIALPKFAETSKQAHAAKAKSVLSNVMSAMATERQKRILRGDFSAIEDLGDTTYAFKQFKNGTQSEILAFPEKNCQTGERGCWKRVNATSYVYYFADSADGDAKFKLFENKLVCDNDSVDCAKLTD